MQRTRSKRHARRKTRKSGGYLNSTNKNKNEAYMRTPKGRAEAYRNDRMKLLSRRKEELRMLKIYPQQIEELEKKIIETQQEYDKAIEEVKKDEITIQAYIGYLMRMLSNIHEKLTNPIRDKSKDTPELEGKYNELYEYIQSLENSVQKRSWWKSKPKQPEIDQIVGAAIAQDKIIRESKEKIIEMKKDLNKKDQKSIERAISGLEDNVQYAIKQVSQFQNQPTSTL